MSRVLNLTAGDLLRSSSATGLDYCLRRAARILFCRRHRKPYCRTFLFWLLSSNSSLHNRQRNGEGALVRELRHLRVAAVRAIGPRAHPDFGPCARLLRAAGIGRLGPFEAEFHPVANCYSVTVGSNLEMFEVKS